MSGRGSRVVSTVLWLATLPLLALSGVYVYRIVDPGPDSERSTWLFVGAPLFVMTAVVVIAAARVGRRPQDR